MLGFLRERRAFEASLCKGCGTPKSDWDAEKKRTGEPAYITVTQVCPGCRELDHARNAMADLEPSQRAGMYVALEARETVLARIAAGEEPEEAF